MEDECEGGVKLFLHLNHLSRKEISPFFTNLKMGITRNVQTIIINREKEDERLDILPTRPPVVTAPRPTRIRVCANAEQDDVAVTTEVRYRYQVEIVPGRDELTDLNWSVSLVFRPNTM